MGEEPKSTQPTLPKHVTQEETNPSISAAVHNQSDQQLDQIDDLTLVTHAKSGERDAFGLLIQRYGKAILNLINKMVQDRGIAEDLWQETFVRAFENIDSYEPRSGGLGIGFASWLYRIATNLALDELRRRRRWRMFSLDSLKPRYSDEPDNDAPYDPPSDQPEASVLLEAKEDIERVRRALDSLPPDWQLILVLREYQDLPYDQIATILRVPLGTVRSRLARAREQLRKALLQESPRKSPGQSPRRIQS